MIAENHKTLCPSPSPSERAGVRSLNIGILGAGSFASFAAKAFLLIRGIKIIAVTDKNNDAAAQMSGDLNAKAYNDYDEFLKDENIDLVYIATPPFLHYEQSKKALLAGKHVICEKPAALQTIEALELQCLARSLDLLYVVNLIQRYNPLYTIVKNIIDEKILGNFLHGFFENYASDENLNKDHWFWDETKSGGIFIEHGVHFFDMFSGWLGEGKVINAIQLQRPGIERRLIDRVQATVSYHDGIVNFYHGFDQPKVLDRQEMRLQFERGEITLYEWVPVKMKLHGLLQKNDLKKLSELPGNLTTHHNSSEDKNVKGRFNEILYDDHATIEYQDTSAKQSRYQQLLTAMLEDQWNWIKNHDHVRVIDNNNAVESTRIAEQATQIAQYFNLEKA
ncbi:MAG: Gfo/Idh/MocA family oxidoreductase [Ginsengibacter sp.]